MRILEGSKYHIVWGGSGRSSTVLQNASDRGKEQEKGLARYIHSNDVFIPSFHSPRNFFIREVQARLVICRIRPRPRQLLAGHRELIG